MEYYEKVIKNVLENIIRDGYETKTEILKRWIDGDTQDDFGNMTGSRTCNTYESKQALIESGFPFDEDLNELLQDAGYDMSILNKGAEVVDVILCELVAPFVASKLANEEV